MQRFYKRTKIELPGEQSLELCNLIQVIEGSEIGQRELKKVTAEGYKLEGKGGLKAGDCISEVWQKDRASFFKDQQNNGMNTTCSFNLCSISLLFFYSCYRFLPFHSVWQKRNELS